MHKVYLPSVTTSFYDLPILTHSDRMHPWFDYLDPSDVTERYWVYMHLQLGSRSVAWFKVQQINS